MPIFIAIKQTHTHTTALCYFTSVPFLSLHFLKMSLEILDISLDKFRSYSIEELSDFIELFGPYATVSESITVSNLNGAILLHLSEEDLKERL